jgi:hypothetical protein
MIRTCFKTAALGFLAGAISVFIFHQGLILVLHLLGAVPFAPYSLRPTEPLHVPQVLSAAFFGGLWGIALVSLITKVRGADRLWVALLFGGIVLPLVGIFIVAQLKGEDVAGSLDWHRLALSFLINGVWGLGAALAYRAIRHLAPDRPKSDRLGT